MKNNHLFPLATLALAAALTACGGGGGGGSSDALTPVPAPAPTAPVASTGMVTDVPAPTYSAASEKLAVFNTLNDDRARCGFGKLAQNAKLDVAAQGHADYYRTAPSVTNLTHYQTVNTAGFTGATPADRITAAGYSALRVNEEMGFAAYGTWFAQPSGSAVPFSVTELSAVNALRSDYATVYHLMGVMTGDRDVGLGLAVRTNSIDPSVTSFTKVLVVDSAVPVGSNVQALAPDALATFPCEGTTGLKPYFLGETPDPFPSVNRDFTPYGQPVYLTSAKGTTLTLTSGTMKKAGTSVAVPTTVLTAANDPQKLLAAHQVFLVPTTHLEDNTRYTVELAGTHTGMVTAANPTGAFTRTFTFQTGTFTSE